MSNQSMQHQDHLPGSKLTSRRQFITTAATSAAVTLTALHPQLARGNETNNKIKLGVIGCGGRGTWIADLFNKHGGYTITAVADYFENRVKNIGDKYNVPAGMRFTGLSCYKRLLEKGNVDAVAIISPPYFHPEQAAAAVDAGKHVYLAKPIAVDVPGCKSIAHSGALASRKKQAFLVDFQTRANDFYIEAVKRVHQGALGKITFGEARYHANRLGVQGSKVGPEGRLRNWVFDIALSGDILVEQNIHSLDVMNWVLGKPPISVVGTGGRKSRVDVGNCNDHFALLYQYHDNIGVTFSSKQYNDGANNAGIVCDIFGSKGRLVTNYGGNVIIYGKNFYRGGRTGQIYQQGAVTNIATFCDMINKKQFDNPTVKPSVQSNLIAIMGRTAADLGQSVTWKKLIESTEKSEGKLQGLKQ